MNATPTTSPLIWLLLRLLLLLSLLLLLVNTMADKNKNVVRFFQEAVRGRVIGASSDARQKQNAAYAKLLGKKKK